MAAKGYAIIISQLLIDKKQKLRNYSEFSYDYSTDMQYNVFFLIL